MNKLAFWPLAWFFGNFKNLFDAAQSEFPKRPEMRSLCECGHVVDSHSIAAGCDHWWRNQMNRRFCECRAFVGTGETRPFYPTHEGDA